MSDEEQNSGARPPLPPAHTQWDHSSQPLTDGSAERRQPPSDGYFGLYIDTMYRTPNPEHVPWPSLATPVSAVNGIPSSHGASSQSASLRQQWQPHLRAVAPTSNFRAPTNTGTDSPSARLSPYGTELSRQNLRYGFGEDLEAPYATPSGGAPGIHRLSSAYDTPSDFDDTRNRSPSKRLSLTQSRVDVNASHNNLYHEDSTIAPTATCFGHQKDVMDWLIGTYGRSPATLSGQQQAVAEPKEASKQPATLTSSTRYGNWNPLGAVPFTAGRQRPIAGDVGLSGAQLIDQVGVQRQQVFSTQPTAPQTALQRTVHGGTTQKLPLNQPDGFWNMRTGTNLGIVLDSLSIEPPNPKVPSAPRNLNSEGIVEALKAGRLQLTAVPWYFVVELRTAVSCTPSTSAHYIHPHPARLIHLGGDFKALARVPDDKDYNEVNEPRVVERSPGRTAWAPPPGVVEICWMTGASMKGYSLKGDYNRVMSWCAPDWLDLALLGDVEITAVELIVFFCLHWRHPEYLKRLIGNGWSAMYIATLMNWAHCATYFDGMRYEAIQRRVDKMAISERREINAFTCRTWEMPATLRADIRDYRVRDLAAGIPRDRLPTGEDEGALTRAIKFVLDHPEHDSLMVSALPDFLAKHRISTTGSLRGQGVENPDRKALTRLKPFLEDYRHRQSR